MRRVIRWAAPLLLVLVVLLGIGVVGPLLDDPDTAEDPRPSASEPAAAKRPAWREVPAGELIDPQRMLKIAPATELGPGRYRRAMRSGAGDISWTVTGDDGKPLTARDARQTVSFPDQDDYTDASGVIAFRGGPWRIGGAYGASPLTHGSLEKVWEQQTSSSSALDATWAGAGWTGQPLIVNWPPATRAAMGTDGDDPEVIYPVLDGRIYRLRLADGSATKKPIDTGNAFKGTGAIDPRGYPLLFAGQGLPGAQPMSFLAVDLTSDDVIYRRPADPAAPRQWLANDSSSLIDAASDTLVTAGENGVLYRIELRTTMDKETGQPTIAPKTTRLVYRGARSSRYGIESSITAYRNLIWFTDNDGHLLCVDIATMQVLWARDIGDDSDATMPLEVSDDGLRIYTGNEVDARGTSGGPRVSNLRKIDALTGAVIWQRDVPVHYDPDSNGGLLGSPVIGSGDLEGTVIFNVARTTAPGAGTIYALDSETGRPRWTRELEQYSWSTPTVVRDDEGRSVLLLGDVSGTMHVIDPTTGKDRSTLQLEGAIEASPAVYDDMVVVGSRGGVIYGLRLS